MKKLLLILLFLGAMITIKAQIPPQIDPGIDPNWGWLPVLPDLLPDTEVVEIDSAITIEWGAVDTMIFYIPDQESVEESKKNYDFSILLSQYENYNHDFNATMFRAVYNETEKLYDRIYELEKIVNRMEQKRIQDSIYKANDKDTFYLPDFLNVEEAEK